MDPVFKSFSSGTGDSQYRVRESCDFDFCRCIEAFEEIEVIECTYRNWLRHSA
jgi:hypothetical protein